LNDAELREACHVGECVSTLMRYTDQVLFSALTVLFKERPEFQNLVAGLGPAALAPCSPRQRVRGNDSLAPLLRTPPRPPKRARPSPNLSDIPGSERYIGKVSAFYASKGYGFIKSPALLDELGSDAMVLASHIATFKVGDEVSFQVSVNRDGQSKAHNLWSVSSPGPIIELPFPNTRSSKQAVSVLMNETSGAEAMRMWRSALQQAGRSIRIAAFGLNQEMLDEVYKAARRGVKIRLLLDFEHQIKQTNLPLALDTVNMSVKYTLSSTRLHAKTLIVDCEDMGRAAMVTGSANATRFSLTSIEWVLFCKMFDGCSACARHLIEDSMREFDHLWYHGDWLDIGNTASTQSLP